MIEERFDVNYKPSLDTVVKPEVSVRSILIKSDSIKNAKNKEPEKDTVPNSTYPLFPAKSRYVISLIMPFAADSISWMYSSKIANLSNSLPSDDEAVEVPFSSSTCVEFYEGMKMALNDLSKTGFKADIHVYDYENADQFLKILKDTGLAESDIIIGPLGSSGGNKISAYCKNHHIWHLYPFSPKLNAENNPWVLKLNPSMEKHWCGLMDYFNKKFTKTNFIYVHERSETDSFLNIALHGYVQEINKSRTDSCHFTDMVIKSGVAIPNVAESYVKGYTNIVLANSYKPNLADAYMRKLSESEVILVGMKQWFENESIDFSFARELNFYFSEEFYTDKTDAGYKAMNKWYNEYYHVDISKRVLYGYDCTKWLGSLLMSKGLNFEAQLNIPYEGFVSVFHLNNKNGIYENNYVPVFKLDDMKIVKAEE